MATLLAENKRMKPASASVQIPRSNMPALSLNLPAGMLAKTPIIIKSQDGHSHTLAKTGALQQQQSRCQPAGTVASLKVKASVQPQQQHYRLLSVPSSPFNASLNCHNSKPTQLIITNNASRINLLPVQKLLPVPIAPAPVTAPAPPPQPPAPPAPSATLLDEKKRTPVFRSVSLDTNASAVSSNPWDDGEDEREETESQVSLSDIMDCLEDVAGWEGVDLDDLDLFKSFTSPPNTSRDTPLASPLPLPSLGALDGLEDVQDLIGMGMDLVPAAAAEPPVCSMSEHNYSCQPQFPACDDPDTCPPSQTYHSSRTEKSSQQPPSVVPVCTGLPLSAPASPLSHHVPGSRPLSPATSSVVSSNYSDVSVEVKTESIGQMLFQCSRCFIVYTSLEQMEKHIGQFHMMHSCRSQFKLTDDNLNTLVKLIWDANLTQNVFTGFLRKFPEPTVGLALQRSNSMSSETGTCSPLPGKLAVSLASPPPFQMPAPVCIPPPGGAASLDLMDLMDDSDDSDSMWGDLSVSSSRCSSVDLSHLTPEMRIELEMPARLPEPKLPPLEGLHYGGTVLGSLPHKRGPYKKHKRLCQQQLHHGATKKSLKGGHAPKRLGRPPGPKKRGLLDASKKVNEMMSCIGKLVKKKQKLLAPLRKPKSVMAQSVPKTPSPPASHIGEEESGLRRRPGRPRLGKRSSQRKCRGVYGINKQSEWCNMCKWKKRCSRFGNDSDDEEDEELESGC